uniref:BVpp95a protein n=1 Tax=Chelonus inanitus TaxID=49201 RepID=D7FB22_9HYME|nr:BVpp95a protein [Chelonus inanitus]
MYENEGIVDKNNELCKKYHEIQRVLNNRKKDLDKTKREIEEIRQSGIKSEKEQENLKEKEKMIEKFTTIIVDNELKIRRIQYQVRKLDKQDYDIQLYKNILYDAQIYLCQRLLGQLNKKLALETDDEKKKELRIDIQKLKKRIEKISFEIKDLHSSYMLRKRRRMISGPYKANFCIKHTLDAKVWGRKYGGAEYQPGLVNGSSCSARRGNGAKNYSFFCSYKHINSQKKTSININ